MYCRIRGELIGPCWEGIELGEGRVSSEHVGDEVLPEVGRDMCRIDGVFVENCAFFLDFLCIDALHEASELGPPVPHPSLSEVPLQAVSKLGSALISCASRASHAAIDDLLHDFGDVVRAFRWRCDLGVSHEKDEVDLVFRHEGGLVRHHLIEHAASAEEVTPMIELSPESLFGRHVLHLAFDDSRFRFDAAEGRFGDAKVTDLDISRVGNEYVRGAEIAVNEPSGTTS